MKKAILGVVIAAAVGGIVYAQSNCLNDRARSINERIERCPVPASERADFKGKEIAAQAQTGTFDRAVYRIEIVEVNHIEDGVEVMARAWQGAEQIGFGDGTVDIERFRIINPPALVSDPNGSIERIRPELPEVGLPENIRKYREDPQEALLQVIEHNISVVRKHDSSRIIEGKRGNTTSTFFADASGDGIAEEAGKGLNWDATHDSTGQSSNDTIADYIIRVLWGGSNAAITRGFFPFDTSSIPDGDTIDSGTISFDLNNDRLDDNDAQAYAGVIASTTQASNTSLVAGDFDACGAIDNPTLASDSTPGISTLSTGSYEDFTLNADGLTAVSKTSYSRYGMREGHDIEDVSITQSSGTGNYIGVLFADTTGTASDPKLVIEHSSAAGETPEVHVTPVF